MSRRRDEGVQIGVAAILLTAGVGGVTAAVIAVGASSTHDWTATWFLILVILFGMVALLGLYVLLALYFPWPLPATRHERTQRPGLQIREIARVEDEDDPLALSPLSQNILDGLVMKIGLHNDGPVDVTANANVLVPDTADWIAQCRPDGTLLGERERMPTAEILPGADTGSIYWQGNVRVPADTSVLIYLRVESEVGWSLGGDPHADLPVAAKFWSQDMDEPVRRDVTI